MAASFLGDNFMADIYHPLFLYVNENMSASLNIERRLNLTIHIPFPKQI